MSSEPLTDDDRELVARAEETLLELYDPDRHTTGAALRTADGTVYTAASVKGGTGKSDLHAEPVALAQALFDGHRGFDAVAAVQPAVGVADPADGTRIVSACGVCRELLIAHAPELWVVLPGEGTEPRKRRLSALLPE